jgi:hypothetical protein
MFCKCADLVIGVITCREFRRNSKHTVILPRYIIIFVYYYICHIYAGYAVMYLEQAISRVYTVASSLYLQFNFDRRHPVVLNYNIKMK